MTGDPYARRHVRRRLRPDRAREPLREGQGKLLQVYTRMHAPSGSRCCSRPTSRTRGLDRSSQILSQFRPITIAGLLVFLLLTTPLVWVLARRLDRSAADRERLLLAAVEASDTERRRIARDLHDGVVQELAGISFAVSATSASWSPARLPHRLDTRLRRTTGPPRPPLAAGRDLPRRAHRERTQRGLEDLLAPAAAAGVDVRLEVADTANVPPEWTALTWRVAQEACATRCGTGSRAGSASW